jgi:short-subunit dehydrogenase
MYAIVTGASSGIGKSIAIALARGGYEIATLSRDEEKLNRLKTELRAVSPKQGSLLVKGDLLNVSDVAQFNQMLREKKGVPDLIVNCAGIYSEVQPSKLSETMLHEQININFFGAFRITQPWIEDFKHRGSGLIISIGSIVTRHPRTSAVAYTLSKQLLDNWMKLLADELRDAGVKVTRIIPGAVITPSWDNEPEELKKNTIHPDEIARTVNLVLSLPGEGWLEEVIIRPLAKNR